MFVQDIAHIDEGYSPLTPELTSWFSGLSLAGFEVTLYGRFWVTPEATRQFKNLEKIPDRATLFRYVLTLEG